MSRKSSRSSSSVERDGDLIDFVARIWNKTASEPYYLLHFLVFFSYIPIRFSAAGVLSPSRSGTLLIREIQAVVAFCILTVIKLVREETWETFIANTFFFAKIFLAAIAFVMDYHVALWYTLAFLVIYLSAQQPPHEGLGDLNHLTPLQLETLLTEGNMSRFWSNSVLHPYLRVYEPVHSSQNSQLHIQIKGCHLGQLIWGFFQMLLKSLEFLLIA
ncbi:uncharacterized protein LOC113779878 isoform X2 [Coffea eugenioides]|uniref:uncharacterized protein LOC113779878 isoform X2 n=1 Tax=Coffea eugenioides TaxID=49369 RepID=UPI000F609EEB|nr:uncharacterized protein LOC113779878 isoform X2 [Coffea eugenioides]